MNYTIRPLGPWVGPVTATRRGAHLFRAHWADTLTLLEYELEQLAGANIVVQVDVTEGELRRDGMLRTHARDGFPGVRVSFDSRHGPLTYATDTYDRVMGYGLQGWQANLRAIALGLQALRAVDRYGISGSGEQYRGWTAIEAAPATATRDQAAQLLAHWSGYNSARIGADPGVLRAAFRAAARRAHPDAGGDAVVFHELTKARNLLEAAR